MKKKAVSAIMLTLLLIGMLTVAFNIQLIEAESSLGITDSWVWVRDTVTGAYGEAVVGAGTALYIARGTSFYRYQLADDSWVELASPPQPDGAAFKTGTALAWDGGDHVYALYGAATGDSRKWFYRHSIPDNSWEALANTTADQGEGDAMAWVSLDNCIYATIGGEQRPTYFVRYDPSTNSWDDAAVADPSVGMGDGASLVWTGGDFLYALRGEFHETSPLYDFWRYDLAADAWASMADIPAGPHSGGVGGVGDGGSLLYVGLWLPDKADYIYALSGNQAQPDSIPDNRTYRYIISADSWERLADLPFGVGHYVGSRLGYADGHIYAWQGTPNTWVGGGDDLARYEFAPTPRTWTVDDDGPADFHTIQEAVNAASDGDTILVYNGTYYENVVVNKTLMVMGEDRGITIIDGNGTGTVVCIIADNVTVTGFTVQGSGSSPEDCGIYLYNSNNIMISQNNINNNTCGIRLYYSDNAAVSENTVKNNGIGITLDHTSGNSISANVLYENENGISLNDAVFNNLSRNNITKNKGYSLLLVGVYLNNVSENSVTNNDGYGIYVSGSGYNILRRNNISDNRYNFGVVCGSGEELSYLINDIDTSNKVNGKPIYYWVNEHRKVIPADAGYVGIVNSTEITIENLTLTNNYYGIMLEYTTNSTIKNVNITNNFRGVELYESTGNNITGSIVTGNKVNIYLDKSDSSYISENILKNSETGIHILSSHKSTFFRNNVTNTNSGIWLEYSSGNTISKNTITNSSYAAISLSSSDYNTLSQNNISNNTCTWAVKLHEATNNDIHENNVANNYQGIWLEWHSVGNAIGRNAITNNSGYGVSIQTFSNAIVAGNNLINNE